VLSEGHDVSQQLKEMTEAVLSLQSNFQREKLMLDKVDRAIAVGEHHEGHHEERKSATNTMLTVETEAGGRGPRRRRRGPQQHVDK